MEEEPISQPIITTHHRGREILFPLFVNTKIEKIEEKGDSLKWNFTLECDIFDDEAISLMIDFTEP